MKISELQNKTLPELRDMVTLEKKKLASLRFQVASNQSRSVRQVRVIRKMIAQIMTLISLKRTTPRKKSQANNT